MRDATDLVNAANFRGGWLETKSKGAVPIVCAAAVGPEYFVVPKAITDKGVEAVLGRVLINRGS